MVLNGKYYGLNRNEKAWFNPGFFCAVLFGYSLQLPLVAKFLPLERLEKGGAWNSTFGLFCSFSAQSFIY
ncbi:hypothetical protein [Sediminibacillus halophilus]|uniref:hypothetical protein n=1 Tax=Sediminibacillus halophilus TaxID=482461 RepID=UPI00094473D9|nr:hypothetical protein [Sediminibacillus halophilus]